ncbi:MAG TPA: glycosyltransferase [Thermodesulfobacteriota bacterium]|nr:glycosyltransferase [Thermodesulfobacteriota bacterium]
MSTFPKLSETFVLGQITELIDRGHDVEIASINKPTEEFVHEDIDKYKLLEKTHYINKSPSRLGFEPEEKLISSLVLTDIIHAHFAANPADWASKFSIALGTPFVITTHAYDIYINPNIEDLREKFDDATKVITTTDYNKDYLSKLLGEKYGANIEIIKYGIDISRFSFNEKKPDGKVKILFIGRLIEKRGPTYAIEAFNKVLGEIPNIELRMIGNGLLKDEVDRLINKLDLNDNVILLGAQPQSAVLKEMAEADIFFLPSLTAGNGDREGSPVSILEAEATGLPIVSTIHNGIPEIVIDGETGFLLPERDTHAMAERLKQLIRDPELKIKMGKAGRAHVQANYDRKNEINNLEKLFENLLKNKVLISDMSENQLSIIRERIRNLGILLSKLDAEIRVKTNEMNEKSKEIGQKNQELNRKDEQITYLQERLNKIESKLVYKVYVKGVKLFENIYQKIKTV